MHDLVQWLKLPTQPRAFKYKTVCNVFIVKYCLHVDCLGEIIRTSGFCTTAPRKRRNERTFAFPTELIVARHFFKVALSLCIKLVNRQN